MSYSKVILHGNLVRDPEVKFLESGTNVCNFTVACNERYTDRDGEQVERTAFVDCVAWARKAEFIGEYFVKGQKILVDGKLQQDEWNDKETGEPRSKLKVHVFEVDFSGNKAENEKLRNERGDNDDVDEENEEDIPF